MSIHNVVLIGAGGNLGPPILTEFLKSSFNITVLSRASSTKSFPASVKVIKTDYSTDSLFEAFRNQDAVVSIVGNEGFAAQAQIIDAAITAGVKRFIPSEFGSDTPNVETHKIVPFFAQKVKVVDYLKSKESKSFSWTALATGPFFDWGLQVGVLGFNLSTKTATIYDGGDAPFSGTNLSTIGTALVKSLSPELEAQTANKFVYIASHTTTQNAILKVVEKLTGDKWTIEKKKSSEVIPAGLEKVGKGDYSAIISLIQAATFGPAALGDFTKIGLWNEQLGLPKENLEESVKSVL